MGSAADPVLDAAPRRIAVLRALQLGDLMCAVPALRALRAANPQAEIALIGLPWAANWSQRMRCIDRWFEFPGWPGLPERAPALRALPAFLALMQECRFDLVLQLHGAGELVNPLVAGFGARSSAGFCRPGQWCPDPRSYIAWPEGGHEIERCLALTDSLGVPRAGIQLEFPVLPCDHSALVQRWPQLAARPYVCIHAGAQLPSRRWPAERFAAVAAALAQAGYAIVLTGTHDERELADALVAALWNRLPRGAALLDLVGRTTLWQVGAVVERAALLVCNDTGVSHIAAALRTPSVVVCCGADPARWAPLDRALHKVLHQPIECRPCAFHDCPVGHGCALAIEPAQVIDAALAQLAAWGRRPPAKVTDAAAA